MHACSSPPSAGLVRCISKEEEAHLAAFRLNNLQAKIAARRELKVQAAAVAYTAPSISDESGMPTPIAVGRTPAVITPLQVTRVTPLLLIHVD